MNWNDLSVLLEVSRSKTMSETARRLAVNQTTISRRLQALEDQLGLKLVARRPDGISLTPAGLEAARACEVMETVAHDLERSLVGRDNELAGSLRVSTTDQFTQYHPELFTSFGERYPSVSLEVESTSHARSLSRREADVAIRWTARPDEGLFGRKLTRVEFALYAAETLRDQIGRRAKPARYPWVAFTEESRARLTERFMKAHAPDARVICRYTDALSLHAAIRAGAGIGFMPCAFADPDPELVRLRPVEPDFGYDIWCLTHIDLSATARVRAFLGHAGEYFDARKALYAGRRPRARRGRSST